MALEQQARYTILAEVNDDDRARQEFVTSLKRVIQARLTPGVRTVWEQRGAPAFRAAHQRDPVTREEVRSAFGDDHYVRMSSALRRVSQERLWDGIAELVDRQLPQLVEHVRAATHAGSAGGELALDPGFEVPEYLSALDVHCMPTGYHRESVDDDVAAGAIYDRGAYVYSMGQLGPLMDDFGQSMIKHFLDVDHRQLRPRRVLDLGCTIGCSTLPYVDRYPDAEVFAIDAGAPVLRYAHARAHELGRRVFFSQQNAEHTSFPDGHFDLIVSHILLHETSHTALANIFAECYRLLAPGGLMAHCEVPQFAGLDPFTQFLADWDTHNNNEPFWGAMHDFDLELLAEDCGFDRDQVATVSIPTGRRLQLGTKTTTLSVIAARR